MKPSKKQLSTEARVTFIMARWACHRNLKKLNINAWHTESNQQKSVELNHMKQRGREVLPPDLTECRKQTLCLNLLIPCSRNGKHHFHIPCPEQTSLIHPGTLIPQPDICFCVRLSHKVMGPWRVLTKFSLFFYLPQISQNRCLTLAEWMNSGRPHRKFGTNWVWQQLRNRYKNRQMEMKTPSLFPS